MADWCRRLTESDRFQAFVLAMIVASAVLLGAETDKSLAARYPWVFEYAGYLIVTTFTLEIVLKLVAEWPRPWKFFRSGWNIFDFLVVTACFVPSLGPTTAVLRLVRVLRAIRVVNAVPELRVIVTAMIKALPSVWYVALLLFLHFYVYAVLGVTLWGKNDPGHFGTLPLAFLTLFRVLTQEDWTDVMYTQMWGRDLYPPQGWDQSGTNEASPVLGALFFVSFIMIGGMVFLNLFVGVILGTMSDVQREESERLLQAKRAAEAAESGEAPLVRLRAELAELEETSRNLQSRIGRLRDAVGELS